MLTFGIGDRPMQRRAFLRIGGALLGGAAFGQLGALGQPALAAVDTRRLLSGKSVILLFLHGGPSQFETFDPKMDAPVGIRSQTGEIATSLPGVTFGTSFPRLAKLAHRLTIVRSYRPGNANHDIKPVVARETSGANVGTLFARVAGSSHPATGMPNNALLVPQAVDPQAKPAQTQFGRFDATGGLGASLAPFVPGAGGELQQDLQLALPLERVEHRRAMLALLDQARFKLAARAERDPVDALRAQAYSTLLGGAVSRAFDLSQEDAQTLARYDTAPLVHPEQIDARWANRPFYIDNSQTLGRLLLLARRLCEAGCGFITVTTNFVWDMHADVNNAPMTVGMGYTAPPLDWALSALLEDLEARGLSDRVLVVCCGEIGRTPQVNAGGGRDHWGNLGPLLLAGGGYSMGQVIGRSTRDGAEPATEPIGVSHLVATMLQTLVNPAELRLVPGVPDDVLRAVTAETIPGLSTS
ncbi:MAG: DUF1501 domain-containing protein [Pirellulales bacterium]|nr:DUF1501 domain-containing protein [Pirellulales bacterium]